MWRDVNAVCPYYAGSGEPARISCGEIIPGARINIFFGRADARDAYYAEYCASQCWARCNVAAAGNAQAETCRYNQGVECRDRSGCDRCGWKQKKTEG